jgi:hypothetical protein
MSVQLLQKPQATSSLLSVTAPSERHTKEATTTQFVHAGFTLGSQLPAQRTDYGKGFILAFVAYTTTKQVTSQTTPCSFSVSQPLPQIQDPVEELRDRSQRNPASAALFWRETTTTYTTTTITVLYFGFVLGQSQAPKHPVPPPPKPLPAQMPKQLAAGDESAVPAEPSFKPAQQVASEPPAATVPLKPVGPSKTSEPPDWQELSFEGKKHRYEVWNASKQVTPKELKIGVKGRPSIYITPRGINGKDSIAEDGLSFTGVDVSGTLCTIPFSEVLSVR